MSCPAGVNIARDGSSPIDLIRARGVTWVRIVAMREYDLREYFKALHDVGIKILLVLAKESGGDLAYYHTFYDGMIDAVQAGNEPDGAGESSWKMSQAEFVAFGKAVRAVWARPFPVLTGGLCSGDPNWLAGADLSWADMLCVHLYLKDAPDPNDIEDLPDVDSAVAGYAVYGLDIGMTEWGWWGDEETRAVGEVASMMAWVLATTQIKLFMYFCLSDNMVPPFGLLAADMSPKARCTPFDQLAPKAGNDGGILSGAAPVDLHAVAKAAAIKHGVPPLNYERQIQQESGFDPNAYNSASGATGIAQLMPTTAQELGVNPWDPIASLVAAAQYDRRLYDNLGKLWRNAFAAYNWGWGNVQKWDGKPSSLPRETRHYLDVILGPGWPEPTMPSGAPVYNRNEPAHAQEHGYDCSQDSLEWALWAWGRQTSDEWLETAMIQAGVLSKELGLLDASGAALAQFIRDQYTELGFDSNNTNPVTFDALLAEFEAPANPYPGLIGGRAWGHWSGLRSADTSRKVLLLANPADGWKGVSQTMNRQQFDALGPFSLVRVMHSDTPSTPPTPVGITRADMDAEIAHLTALRDKIPQ